MRNAVRAWGRSFRGEDGFTMVEMLVVLIIIGALLALAVPAYIGYEVRAADNAAKANLRASLPAVEAYRADNGSYQGMTAAALRASYDQGLATNVAVVGTPDASFCLTDTEGGRVWSVDGPGTTVASFRNNATCS